MKKICIFLLVVLLSANMFPRAAEPKNAGGEYSAPPSYEDFADGIIQWEKLQYDIAADKPLLSPELWEQRPVQTLTWLVFALERLGESGSYSEYLDALSDWIAEMYETPQKLSANKATEWHRAALGILAAGGDPTDVNGIDLIADGIYARDESTSLGKQGINGWIWGLIVLDTKGYETPSDASATRESILNEIIRMRLADGGFALTGTSLDPDITAAALIALSPYRNTTDIYGQSGERDGATVEEVIDEALEALSRVQCESGGYRNPFSGENAESTAQVLLALSTLGVDWQNDSRFVKNGTNLYEALAAYQTEDGGIRHLPGDENADTTASVQALYTIAALIRAEHGQDTLFVFGTETNKEETDVPESETSDSNHDFQEETGSSAPQTGDGAVWALSSTALGCAVILFLRLRRTAR